MTTNLIGQTILKQYRVDSFIASGGMGAVYRVWDLDRNVPLAMKVLHEDFLDDPVVLKSFKREANALKKLAHPNIVPFYGVEITRGLAYLLARFIDGPSLKTILRDRDKPLSETESLTILKAISAALGYAHRNEVVHCDVKPGNVMIDQGGSIFLTDFGIARHAESTKTSFGGAVGTAFYMAPEQFLEREVTPATDVYALGVLLFEMLTGQRPFSGDEIEAGGTGETRRNRIMHAHLRLPPPDPRSVNPAISPELSQVILKALAKDPAERYQSTQEFFTAACQAVGTNMEALPDRIEVPGQHQISPPPPDDKPSLPDFGLPKASSRTWIVGGAVLAALVAVIFLVIQLLPKNGPIAEQPPSDGLAQLAAESESEEPQAVGASSGGEAAIAGEAPDPEEAASVGEAESPTETATSTTTPSPMPTYTPSVTPTQTPEPASIYDLVFASDQDGDFSIILMDTDTGESLQLERPDGVDRVWWPTFCGGEVAVEGVDHDSNYQSIYLIDVFGNTREVPHPAKAVRLGVPRCQPGTDILTYSANVGKIWGIFFHDISAKSTDQMYPDNALVAGYASWPADGEGFVFQLITQSGENLIYWMEAPRGNYYRIGSGGNPAVSPDGTQITRSCRISGDNRVLCVSSLNGENSYELVTITRKKISNISIQPSSTWSRDGEWIYYASAEDGDWDIYRIHPDGSDKENLTNQWSSNEIMPALKW